MTTRCKFRCISVTKQENWYGKPGFLYSAKFCAVMDNNPENKAFFDSTPSGSLEVGTYKQDVFEPGKEYFIDITVAEPVVA